MLKAAICSLALVISANSYVPESADAPVPMEKNSYSQIDDALAPVADPISTPGAAKLAPVPCNPKTDPGCER